MVVASPISNKDESVSMFENKWLDKLTHMHPSTPLVIYGPVIVYLLYHTYVARQVGVVTALGLFAAGLFVWTFTEYLLHRFVFHYHPTSPFGKRVHFVFHGVHHDYPRDSTRLVMAPVVSVPLACAFYFMFLVLVGASMVPPFFVGFVGGYVCYDMIHYATHHWPMHHRLGQWLKQYHALHHYHNADRSYGVSSPLWDYVFGTLPQRLPRVRGMANRVEISA
jgi:sterol desaturase/sphingolipid hydroxylase (fatty acid hydroxylase superfamily)